MEIRQAVRRLWPAMRGRAPARTNDVKVVLADYYAALQSTGLYSAYRARPWPVERAVAEAYERVVWVYKSVEAVSSHASSLPFRLKQGEKVLDDHPLYRVMNRQANPMETGRQFRKRLSAQILLSKRGAFVEVTKSRGGDIVRLDLLPPGRTQPIPGSGKELIRYFEVVRADGTRQQIEPERVRWFRDPHPLDPYSGVTPLEAAGMSIELDFFARLYNVATLKNDGRPGGVVAVDGEMDPGDMARLGDQFGKGPVEAGKVAVIAGKVSYVDLAVRPRDMAYEQTSTTAKKEILTAFGVPESVIGDASGRTWDNAEQEEYNFWSITMPPHLGLITSGLDEDSEDDLEGFFDTSSIEVLQRADRARREEARVEFEQGLISIDEYRGIAGYNAVDNEHARALWMPSGRTPLPTSDKDAEKLGLGQAQQPEPATQPGPTVEQTAQPAIDGPNGQPGAQETGGQDQAAQERPAAARKHLSLVPAAPPPALPVARPVIRLTRPPAHTKTRAVASAVAESAPDAAAHDKLETALAAALAALMVRLAKRTRARLTSPKTRKHTRHWAPEYERDTRVGTKQIDAAAAVDAGRWQQEVEEAAQPIVEAAAVAAGAALLADLGAAPLPMPATVAPVVGGIVAALGAAAAVQAAKLSTLISGLDSSGAAIDALEAAVREQAAKLTGWADAVAAQAATATINGARDQTAQAASDAEPGLNIVRLWRHRSDHKVRATHRAAGGQTRPLGETFEVGEAWLRYPGDPDGPPGETYGCRCWLIHRSTVTGQFVPAPPGAITRAPQPKPIAQIAAGA